jgi:hypothetical protein
VCQSCCIHAEVKRQTEKSMDDCRASITMLRVGMASGNQGPFIFLISGNKVDCLSLRDLPTAYGCPPGSMVIPLPSAFMTDNVWLLLVPYLAEGICEMKVIRDHPEWWVAISCNGFGSHVNVHLAQDIFSHSKILVVKEEGDTLHVNQVYDQSVAKQDKLLMQQNLELARKSLGKTWIDQYYLIAVTANAQKKVPKQSWYSHLSK